MKKQKLVLKLYSNRPYKKILQVFASAQQRESVDMSSKNDREWSGFSICLALPLEHCLSAKGASLREAAKISVCRKTVGTNVFLEDISTDSLCVSSHIIPIIPPTTCTINAATHAMAHCQITTPTAHLPPSSLFTEAIAATQGV